MDWTVIFAAAGFAVALATGIGGLVWLIIKLAIQPIAEDVAYLKVSLRPMELKLKSEQELARMIQIQVSEHKDYCRREREEREAMQHRLSAGHIVAAVIIAALLALLSTGCATYEVDPATGTGTSYGMFRDLAVTERITYNTDGSIAIRETSISTKSTTSDVMTAASKMAP
jgi:hypothetical protein